MAQIIDPQFEAYKKRLFDEVEKGNLVMIKALAKKNPALLNSLDEKGFSVLHLAAGNSRVDVIEWLMSDEGRSAGFSSVLSRAEGSFTALYLAAATSDLECLKAIVYGCKEENGEREQMLNAVGEDGLNVLHVATEGNKPAIIKWLLSEKKGGGREAGFNSVLATSKHRQMTALHFAAEKGDLECFVAIVEGCKVENGERKEMLNAVTNQGATVLHVAAHHGHVSIINWLLSKGRDKGFESILTRTTDSSSSITALDATAAQGHLDCFTAIVEGCKVENGERAQMLNAVDNQGGTVLHTAAHHGHVSIIKWILSKGRDNGFESIIIRTTNPSSITALDKAASNGHLETCKAIVSGCKVENGERDQMLNGLDDRGLTGLHFAAVGGHTSVVNWLLSDKPGGGRALGFKNVLARSKKEGGTPLHFAAPEGHLETLKAIVNGCKVENGEREQMLNAVGEQQWTVLHYAVRCGHSDIVSWLLSHDTGGGRANGLKSETITAAIAYSMSALHYAAYSSSVEILCTLLSGCTVGEKLKMFLTVDKWGWTVFHWAAQFGRIDNIRELLLHHEETKMIVDHRDHRGMTALHRVILDGGVDEESKKEWNAGVNPDDPNRAPREEVVAALLTYEIDDDEEEGGARGQAASSTNKTNEQKQQQAAFIDVNLGLKIEKRE